MINSLTFGADEGAINDESRGVKGHKGCRGKC